MRSKAVGLALDVFPPLKSRRSDTLSATQALSRIERHSRTAASQFPRRVIQFRPELVQMRDPSAYFQIPRDLLVFGFVARFTGDVGRGFQEAEELQAVERLLIGPLL